LGGRIGDAGEAAGSVEALLGLGSGAEQALEERRG
jgi:hypothetical protein